MDWIKNIRRKISIETIIFIFVAALFVIGTYDYGFKTHQNDCLMTYMFQYPEYIVSD